MIYNCLWEDLTNLCVASLKIFRDNLRFMAMLSMIDKSIRLLLSKGNV